MANSKFIESGTAATQGFEFFSAVETAGTCTITSDAQAIFGSVRSIKASSGATNGNGDIYKSGVLADAGRRITFGYRFHGTLNASGAGGDIVLFTDSARTNVIYELGITNAGKLVVFKGDGTTVYGTGTTVLSVDKDYRISIVYTVTSTTVNSFKVYINGTLELTVTNVTLAATGSDTLYFNIGNNNTVGANVSYYYAHIYVDDGTSGDPGNIHVTAKRPNANGTTNGFTTQIGAGGSGYGTGHSPQVNERPLSITNGWSIASAGSAITEEYNIESAATGDVNIAAATIVDYVGWLYTKSLASETGKIIVNNVQTNISLTSTASLFTQIASSTTYPAGTGTDIGEITSTTVTTISLYECGIIFAFITPAVSTLADDFTGSVINAVKWNIYTASNGTVSESGGVLKETPAATTNGSWGGIYSVGTYDLTGSTAYIQQVNVGAGNTFVDLTLSLEPLPANDFIFIGVDTGLNKLQAGDEIAGVSTVRASVTYNSATMQWIRIRESAGTVYFEYATDYYGTWTTLDSRAPAVAIVNLYVVIDDYEYNNLGTPGTATLDNFNTPPPLTSAFMFPISQPIPDKTEIVSY